MAKIKDITVTSSMQLGFGLLKSEASITFELAAGDDLRDEYIRHQAVCDSAVADHIKRQKKSRLKFSQETKRELRDAGLL